MPEINPVKETAEALQGVLREVPIYQDLAQPAIQEAGKNLVVIGKTVKVLLTPLRLVVWGYETIENYINTRVSEKLINIPNENIITPPLEIAGPTIEALRFAGNNEEIRELYANLLANSMDSETVDFVHPSFVEIIKNISSDESRLLTYFIGNLQYPLIDLKGRNMENEFFEIFYKNHSNFKNASNNKIKNISLIPSYIDNLCRLGLVNIPSDEYLSEDKLYENLQNDNYLDEIKSKIVGSNKVVEFHKKYVRLTSFGQQFIENVVIDKSS